MKRLTVAAGTLAAALTLTSATLAATVTGSISGPVTAAAGKTFSVKTTLSPTGKSTVTVSDKTIVTQQKRVARSALATGVCVFAIGKKSGTGVVTATRLTLSAPVNKTCTSGFGAPNRSGGAPPNGGGAPPGGQSGGKQPTPPAGLASGGFAFGEIVKIKGATLTLRANTGGSTGTTMVKVSAGAQLLETVHTGKSAIKAGLCAFVNGTSSDKGVTVKAQSVSLSDETKGSCTARRP